MSLWHRVQTARAARRLRARAKNIGIIGRLWLHGGGDVEVGTDVKFDGGAVGIELRTFPGAQLRIGEMTVLREGVSIETSKSIHIGNRVHLGPFVKIMDSNFHALQGDRHRRPTPEPIVIEDGAQLEERVIILPGVTIGAGAKIRARSVVNRHVPAGVEVSGNPARPVRR